MSDLPEGWDESAERIARYCARSREAATPTMTYADRVDAALGGIIDYLADHGWPPRSDHPLFQAARAAIERESHETLKHVLHGHFWCEAPGTADPIGEAVTDKLGVHQLTRAFTDHQWAVVWTLADVLRHGGTWHAAAARLGMTPGAYRMTLHVARRKARQLWVAPGETPRGHWARGGTWDTTRNTRMAGRIRNRTRQRARRKAA